MRAVLLALLGVLIALDLASWPVVLVVSVIGLSAATNADWHGGLKSAG
jgi:hypothetical protein